MKTAEEWVKDLEFCCSDIEEAKVIRAIQADALRQAIYRIRNDDLWTGLARSHFVSLIAKDLDELEKERHDNP